MREQFNNNLRESAELAREHLSIMHKDKRTLADLIAFCEKEEESDSIENPMFTFREPVTQRASPHPQMKQVRLLESSYGSS